MVPIQKCEFEIAIIRLTPTGPTFTEIAIIRLTPTGPTFTEIVFTFLLKFNR